MRREINRLFFSRNNKIFVFITSDLACMNVTKKKCLQLAATSSVTNIRKECDNNGMSPDNTAQISHALSFVITSQH